MARLVSDPAEPIEEGIRRLKSFWIMRRINHWVDHIKFNHVPSLAHNVSQDEYLARHEDRKNFFWMPNKREKRSVAYDLFEQRNYEYKRALNNITRRVLSPVCIIICRWTRKNLNSFEHCDETFPPFQMLCIARTMALGSQTHRRRLDHNYSKQNRLQLAICSMLSGLLLYRIVLVSTSIAVHKSGHLCIWLLFRVTH